MNIKEVKKNLADQLMSFQLSGLNQINQMEKEHKKELEVSRLRGDRRGKIICRVWKKSIKRR